ncbi:MAG: thiol:disulfide interchange protein DsbA [Steroidobacteraceae bacterium]
MSLPLFKSLVPLLAAVLAMTAGTPAGAQAVAGREYRELPTPQPTANPGKIEVLEFFSYGCPHCNDFYPLLNAWLARQGKDVVLRREAVGLGREAWVNLARAYYALNSSGDLPKLDAALFHALHAERLQLYDEKSLADWVRKQGGDADKFAAAYVSFGVNNQTVQADTMAQAYMLEGIPMLAVNGRYVVLGNSPEAVLANADKVVAMARAARPAAPGKTPRTK